MHAVRRCPYTCSLGRYRLDIRGLAEEFTSTVGHYGMLYSHSQVNGIQIRSTATVMELLRSKVS
jgi:hypothetical protein